MGKHSGNLIREARKRIGLSQIEVACQADVSRRTVQNAEAGKDGVKRSSVYAIAEVLGVELDTPERTESEQIPNSESFSYWPFGLFQFVRAKLKPSEAAFCTNEAEVREVLENMWHNLHSGLQDLPADLRNRFRISYPKFVTKNGYIERYLSIWRANPMSLSFSSAQGKRTGVSIILPVSEDVYSDFLNGELGSFDLVGSQVLPSSPTCIFESLALFADYRDQPHTMTDALSFVAFHQLAVLSGDPQAGSVRLGTFATRDQNVKRMRKAGLSAKQTRTPKLNFQVWELSEDNWRDSAGDDQVRSSTLLHFTQLRRRLTQNVRAKITLKALAAYKRLIRPAVVPHDKVA